MRYESLPADLYKRNRTKFIDRISVKEIAIFHSNDPMPTNADGIMGFRQNNDLLYLTGIDQEETTLIISKNQEVLFIRETSDLIKIWEGSKLTKKEASELSGIKDVRWFSEYENYLDSIVSKYEMVLLSNNEHTRADSPVETRNNRFTAQFKEKYKSIKTKTSAPILHHLRYFKEQEEVKQIQTACDITQKAFERILKFIKPNIYEYEIEAEITHEFLINKSRGHAYQPIVASGGNACILHYIENNDKCLDGELILMDFGAEYGNYNADLTRTVPVNGKFTQRQKDVYNATLNVHNFAKEILSPGNNFEILNKEVPLFMESELIKLGLIDKMDVKNQDPKKPLYRKYFMHGTSHSLGLDVHDVDNRTLPFEEGMVFTCEPGIYIPEENIGVRLENDLVITENGNYDLMQSIPITVEEIENIMNG